MTGRIFHLNDQGEATPMEEARYDAERTLQELLAKHPDLLAGDQIDSVEPRRWLLITREMTVASEEDGAERWSLDHAVSRSTAVIDNRAISAGRIAQLISSSNAAFDVGSATLSIARSSSGRNIRGPFALCALRIVLAGGRSDSVP
jgi:hypothetical protein